MTTHVCTSATRYSHPLPPEDPAKLQGPELGQLMVYRGKSFGVTYEEGSTEPTPMPKTPDRVVRVTARSYVWSPNECSSRGGYRHYDWSVIEDVLDPKWHVVVDDKDLEWIPGTWA